MDGKIICISSDDEQITNDSDNMSNSKKNGTKRLVMKVENLQSKMEASSNTNGETETLGEKRKANNNNDNVVKKRVKLISSNKEQKGKTVEHEKDVEESKRTSQGTEKADKISLKPQLIVKEKKSILQVERDTFPMFISLCLQKDRSPEMEIIVNKLKRRYEQLDPKYTNSEAFISFVNEKRRAIANSSKKLYIHIQEVLNEMKNSCRGHSKLSVNKNNSETPSTSRNMSDGDDTGKNETTKEEEEEDETDMRNLNRKINIICQAMEKCEKYIKKLEEAEINFDDENNSNYMKLEKYKHRMVQLYNKYCEYTGDNADAGRPYLRPKHISTTGIVAVDRAITNFINAKISKRKTLKKIGAFTNALIFPDYTDILQCVTKCNELHDLGLSNKKKQQIAKKAFTELGEHLQRVRQEDFWDTFSLFLEMEDNDPAVKDEALRKKLIESEVEGEKRMRKIFQEYVTKQEEMKEEQCDDVNTSSENEGEEEETSDQNGNDSDITLSLSTKDEESDKEDVNKLSPDEGKITESKESRVTRSQKKFKVNKSEKGNESGSNSNDILSDDGSHASSNVLNKDNKLETDKDDNSKLSGCVVNNCNRENELDAEVITIINEVPNSKKTASCASTVTNVLKSPEPDNAVNNRTEENVSNVVSDETIENNQLEEKKPPLLRVRSFAKHPTTWEDGQEKDARKENPVVTKMTKIQSSPNFIQVVRDNKIVHLNIPSVKRIISVQNITNNYIRIQSNNAQNVIAASKSLPQVVGVNSGATIIDVASNSSVGQRGGGGAGVSITYPTKTKNGPVRIIPLTRKADTQISTANKPPPVSQ